MYLPHNRRQVIQIYVLPDEVLLAIFDLYVVQDLAQMGTKPEIEKWKSLVHVCRRWRSLVFQSPARLNLRLVCTPGTPARETLNVWPALPLLIGADLSSASSEDNIIFALGHINRIRDVGLWEVSGPRLEKVLAAMQVPFPNVTSLHLGAPLSCYPLRPIPDSFLGGSAPCLQQFTLHNIPFPGLPKFLSSTTHLVDLHLVVPLSVYIPPEDMATYLSMLTSLKNFTLIFQNSQSLPDMEAQRLPQATCSVLSALRIFEYQGPSGYLEDLVARIDAPLLSRFHAAFFYEPNFIIPQLFKFISRTPTLEAPVVAYVVFERDAARIKLISQTLGRGVFQVQIPWRRPAWQLSSLVQVLASSSCPFFTVVNLFIKDLDSSFSTKSRVETTQWWEVMRLFVAVKNIFLFETIAFHIAYSLQALGGGRSIEVLPALQEIIVLRPPEDRLPDASGLVDRQGPMEQFVAARQLLGQTISITDSQWQESRRRVDD